MKTLLERLNNNKLVEMRNRVEALSQHIPPEIKAYLDSDHYKEIVRTSQQIESHFPHLTRLQSSKGYFILQKMKQATIELVNDYGYAEPLTDYDRQLLGYAFEMADILNESSATLEKDFTNNEVLASINSINDSEEVNAIYEEIKQSGDNIVLSRKRFNEFSAWLMMFIELFINNTQPTEHNENSQAFNQSAGYVDKQSVVNNDDKITHNYHNSNGTQIIINGDNVTFHCQDLNTLKE